MSDRMKRPSESCRTWFRIESWPDWFIVGHPIHDSRPRRSLATRTPILILLCKTVGLFRKWRTSRASCGVQWLGHCGAYGWGPLRYLWF